MHEFVGETEINDLKNASKVTYVYIYHPDCKFCKKSRLEWENFSKDFQSKHKDTEMTIGAINLSLAKNRE